MGLIALLLLRAACSGPNTKTPSPPLGGFSHVGYRMVLQLHWLLCWPQCSHAGGIPRSVDHGRTLEEEEAIAMLVLL